MFFKIIFHADEERNRLYQKWVSIGTLIGMAFAAIVWFSPIADKWHATEPEVDLKVIESMQEHMIEQATVPYAMKNDIVHQGNIRIEEKILKARGQIKDIEDDLDAGKIKTSDIPAADRKIERLKADIILWNSRFEPEPGALHSHGS